MNPKLSIITINLNNASGLMKTVDSVDQQCYTDYELIIIDGASSDNSLEIIKEFQTKAKFNDPIKYKWISEPDNGIYHAMNKGISLAQGDYCFFLNSGDYLVSDKTIESIFRKDPKADILFGNLIICNENEITGKVRGKKEITFLDLYCSNVVKHQSSFIRRSVFHEYGFYDDKLRIVADWEFFLRTLGFHDVSYEFIDLDVAFFDNNGLSSNSNEITAKERKLVIQKYLSPLMIPDYEKLRKNNLIQPALNNRFTYFIIRAFAKILTKSGL